MSTMAIETQLGTDRDLQDAVIRYLSDARLRRSSPNHVPLSQAQASRAEKFARFLARRYYRDRLVRSFRYSHLFRAEIGGSAEEISAGPLFNEFLRDCVLGSFESACRVGKMAEDYLAVPVDKAPGPWWSELLTYEEAFFLQAATAENVPVGKVPRRGLSTVVRRFQWSLPELLSRLRENQEVINLAQKSVDLLFSRTREGRIYVVEMEGATAAVFSAVNGEGSVEELADAVGISPASCQSILASLRQIGAVVGPG